MNDKIEKQVFKLPPFKRMCMTIGELPTSYLESMTYYEMLVWFTKYLGETVIPTINNNAEAITEIQELYTKLQDYVNNYFDNLDVQEEINNKLDKMAEDGTLNEIIGEFIEFSKKSYIIEEITTETINVQNNNGNVYITHIPHTDNENNLIPIKHGFANDIIDTGAERPTDFSYRHNATFCSNASLAEIGSHAGIPVNDLLGVYIHNGQLLKDNRNQINNVDPSWKNVRYILAIKENNVLTAYPETTSVNDLINDGVKETLNGFLPILKNGQNTRKSLVAEGYTYWRESNFIVTSDETPIYNKIYFTLNNTSNEYEGHFHLDQFNSGVTYYEEASNTERQPRTIIGQKANGDILFFANNGRGDINNIGMTLYEFTTIAQYYGCEFAFVLDGGGSTCSVFRNQMINQPSDGPSQYSKHYNGEGTIIRPVSDFLYFSKDPKTETDENVNYILKRLQELDKKIDDIKIKEESNFMSTTRFYEQEGEQHVFNFAKWNNELKNFIDTFRIYIDNPGGEFSKGMSINEIDSTGNSNTVIRFGKDSGIKYLNSKLGLLYDNIPKLPNSADLNNLPDRLCLVRADREQTFENAPFTTETYNYFIFQFGFDNYRVQFAISLAFDTLIKVRVLTSSWSPWKTIQMVS